MGDAGGKVDKYQKGDRVFAKLKGYPPWPAQVQERSAGKEEKYFLHFYGTHDSAHVKPQMMYPYNPDTISKYGKPSKPSPTFKKAMEEIEANLELYLSTEEPQALEQEEDIFEEGELQIDETPPPVLKREGKISTLKSTPKEHVAKQSVVKQPVVKQPVAKQPVVKQPAVKQPVVKQPVVKQPPRRISKATKRDSISTSSVINVPSPVSETPPPIAAPQPEIVSRSGRKIKPKRFADDEIGSPVSILAKAALQSSFDESKAETPSAPKRTKKGQKFGGLPEAPLPPVIPPAPPVLIEAPTPKITKEQAVPKSKGKPARAVSKVVAESQPQPRPTPPVSTVSLRRKTTSVSSVSTPVTAPVPVPVPVPVLVPAPVESPVPSPPEILDSESNTTPALSKADEDEPMEDFTEEDTHEYTEDKENSAGSWVNNAREEDSGSDESSSFKTEIKQFTEIPVSPDESSAESIKITLAVKKDTEVEVTFNHDKPKEFPTQTARLEWDLATAKNVLKIRQTLESLEPQSVEIFNLLAAVVEQKEEEILDMMEKEMSEKRTEKLRKLRVEGEVIEIIGDVINCLSSRAADCDRAIELLDRLKNHTLDTLILKKNPEIVETVRKLRHYEGNAEEWDLTPDETDQFDEKTLIIRETSHKIYESFKTIFEITDKSFQEVYEEELAKFKEHCSIMAPKDILNLTDDPTTVEEADTANATEDMDCDENPDGDLEEGTNDVDDDDMELNAVDEDRSEENGDFSDADIDESTVDDEGGIDGDEESENTAENDTEETDNDVDADAVLGDDHLNNESDTLGSESET